MKMNLPSLRRILVVTLGLSFAHFATAGYRGVVDGPDECADVRLDKRADARVVERLKTGEAFTFESKEGDGWCKVTLASGKTGWMQCNCVRLFFTKKSWPPGTPTELVPTFGQKYYKVMLRAESGDKDALKKFFGFGKDLDGAGAEEHAAVVSRMLHILGDARLADFLRNESPVYQAEIRDSFIGSLRDAGAPIESEEYVRRHFPKTAKIFSRPKFQNDGKATTEGKPPK